MACSKCLKMLSCCFMGNCHITDYEFQVGLLECFFRVIPRKQRAAIIKQVFSNELVSHGLMNIKDCEFETVSDYRFIFCYIDLHCGKSKLICF